MKDEKLLAAYETLGLEYGASISEIKKSHKSKAVAAHPDKNNGNSGDFDKIQNAHDTVIGKDIEQQAATALTQIDDSLKRNELPNENPLSVFYRKLHDDLKKNEEDSLKITKEWRNAYQIALNKALSFKLFLENYEAHYNSWLPSIKNVDAQIELLKSMQDAENWRKIFSSTPKPQNFDEDVHSKLRLLYRIRSLLSKAFVVNNAGTIECPIAGNIHLIDNFETLYDEYSNSQTPEFSRIMKKFQVLKELKDFQNIKKQLIGINPQQKIASFLSNREYAKAIIGFYLQTVYCISTLTQYFNSNDTNQQEALIKHFNEVDCLKYAEAAKRVTDIQNNTSDITNNSRYAYQAFFTALSTSALLFLTGEKPFIIYQRAASLSLLYPLAFKATVNIISYFNTSVDTSIIQTSLLSSFLFGVTNTSFTANSFLQKAGFFTLLSYDSNPFTGIKLPGVIDISSSILNTAFALGCTSSLGFQHNGLLKFAVNSAAFLTINKLVLPSLDAYIEDKSYAFAVKASVATCAVAALVYAFDGGKMLSSINVSSLLSRGAAIAA